MRFYTLVHIEKDEISLHNNSGSIRSFDEQVYLYLSCARQLHLSLKSSGIELVVITNDKAFLERLNKNEYDITILQINFTLHVPSGIKFYSAHYKIEIYKYLSSLTDDYVGLIDCDVVCINEMPDCFKNIIRYKTPLYYDITDQMVPAYGEERIINDKEKLGKTKSIGLWAGGEFIAGPPDFFERLFKEIESIKENYFRNFDSFLHQGDEMLTSVAIENMLLKSNERIIDAGVLSIIARFWSYKPIHVQRSIGVYTNHFLLHLPSDKKFIINLNENDLKGEGFFRNYKQHLFISRAIEKTFKGIKPYVKIVRKRLAI